MWGRTLLKGQACYWLAVYTIPFNKTLHAYARHFWLSLSFIFCLPQIFVANFESAMHRRMHEQEGAYRHCAKVIILRGIKVSAWWVGKGCLNLYDSVRSCVSLIWSMRVSPSFSMLLLIAIHCTMRVDTRSIGPRWATRRPSRNLWSAGKQYGRKKSQQPETLQHQTAYNGCRCVAISMWDGFNNSLRTASSFIVSIFWVFSRPVTQLSTFFECCTLLLENFCCWVCNPLFAGCILSTDCCPTALLAQTRDRRWQKGHCSMQIKWTLTLLF